MRVQIGGRAQPGFDEPIDLMMDCHRRIEGFLTVLERVAARADSAPLDEEATRALRAALTYFRNAAPKHTADEEDSLFPALRALNRPDLDPLLEQAATLEAQHREADQLHARVTCIAERWLETGRIDPPDLSALRRDLASLRELYREHIAFEDTNLFPQARRLLDHQTLRAIGEEMAARRGIPAIHTLPVHPTAHLPNTPP